MSTPHQRSRSTLSSYEEHPKTPLSEKLRDEMTDLLDRFPTLLDKFTTALKQEATEKGDNVFSCEEVADLQDRLFHSQQELYQVKESLESLQTFQFIAKGLDEEAIFDHVVPELTRGFSKEDIDETVKGVHKAVQKYVEEGSKDLQVICRTFLDEFQDKYMMVCGFGAKMAISSEWDPHRLNIVFPQRNNFRIAVIKRFDHRKGKKRRENEETSLNSNSSCSVGPSVLCGEETGKEKAETVREATTSPEITEEKASRKKTFSSTPELTFDATGLDNDWTLRDSIVWNQTEGFAKWQTDEIIEALTQAFQKYQREKATDVQRIANYTHKHLEGRYVIVCGFETKMQFDKKSYWGYRLNLCFPAQNNFRITVWRK